MNQIYKHFNNLVLCFVLSACGKQISLLKDTPESSVARQKVKSATSQIPVGAESFYFGVGTLNSLFRNDSSSTTLASLKYLGVLPTPGSQAHGKAPYEVPVLELTSYIEDNYTGAHGRDQYITLKTRFYATRITQDSICFENLDPRPTGYYGSKDVILAISADKSIRFWSYEESQNQGRLAGGNLSEEISKVAASLGYTKTQK